ncbi:uncharacterized protein LOC108659117 [Drosophila navojoa]|uniref:uncharacterized protein LOC108659117 n=1 Tax=Drosophila navojoa TaxID=7232 RepID=UPI000847508C|nr:uncharacterized protein LOC108659117 [Drosophila navojoa]
MTFELFSLSSQPLNGTTQPLSHERTWCALAAVATAAGAAGPRPRLPEGAGRSSTLICIVHGARFAVRSLAQAKRVRCAALHWQHVESVLIGSKPAAQIETANSQ